MSTANDTVTTFTKTDAIRGAVEYWKNQIVTNQGATPWNMPELKDLPREQKNEYIELVDEASQEVYDAMVKAMEKLLVKKKKIIKKAQ